MTAKNLFYASAAILFLVIAYSVRPNIASGQPPIVFEAVDFEGPGDGLAIDSEGRIYRSLDFGGGPQDFDVQWYVIAQLPENLRTSLIVGFESDGHNHTVLLRGGEVYQYIDGSGQFWRRGNIFSNVVSDVPPPENKSWSRMKDKYRED